MAKYITTVPGSLEQLRKYIYHNGPNLGATLSLEEEISGTADGVKYLIGTYERYAVLGENRVSLNIVLLEISEGVRVSDNVEKTDKMDQVMLCGRRCCQQQKQS